MKRRAIQRAARAGTGLQMTAERTKMRGSCSHLFRFVRTTRLAPTGGVCAECLRREETPKYWVLRTRLWLKQQAPMLKIKKEWHKRCTHFRVSEQHDDATIPG